MRIRPDPDPHHCLQPFHVLWRWGDNKALQRSALQKGIVKEVGTQPLSFARQKQSKMINSRMGNILTYSISLSLRKIIFISYLK